MRSRRSTGILWQVTSPTAETGRVCATHVWQCFAQSGGTLGLHWVSDLALEGDVEVQGDQGELLLLLVKGGISYTCRVDVATGKATLSIDGGQGRVCRE